MVQLVAQVSARLAVLADAPAGFRNEMRSAPATCCRMAVCGATARSHEADHPLRNSSKQCHSAIATAAMEHAQLAMNVPHSITSSAVTCWNMNCSNASSCSTGTTNSSNLQRAAMPSRGSSGVGMTETGQTDQQQLEPQHTVPT